MADQPPASSNPSSSNANVTLQRSDGRATDGPIVYAGFWRRALAYLVDYLLTVTLSIILVMLTVSGLGNSGGSAVGAAYAIAFVAGLLYFTLLESSSLQATLGKRALGCKVCGLDGNRISFGRAVGRYFAKIISGLLLGIGYVMAGFTARRQCLHDMIADTLVVKYPVPAAEIASAPPAPTSGFFTAAMIILWIFLGPFGIGIVAAIAIPAYQNYTIRAQIMEGLIAADEAKSAVADNVGKFADWKEITTASIGLTPRTLKYVEGIEVISGVVVVTYGNGANARISGKTIVLAPLRQGEALLWICGSAPIPEGAIPVLDPAKYTSVEPQYLPTSCHR